MTKALVLNPSQWEKLKSRLIQDYSLSTVVLSYKMKEVLGFSVRTHTEWNKDSEFGHMVSKITIRLDFYNEPKRTMFMLKYSEYLEREKA